MRLEPVTGKAFQVICAGCGNLLDAETKTFAGRPFYTVFADLDGPAFKAYYCNNCATQRMPSLFRKSTAAESFAME